MKSLTNLNEQQHDTPQNLMLSHYAETTAATLQRKFDALTDPGAHELIVGIQQKRGDDAALLAAELLAQRRAERISSVDA